ncbi:MAG: hypothetical protein J4F41_10130, partial [Alphaproteobacteria bacterium]|nr:hypothetical protein [Alphaproteobacteria bacterium]
EIIEVNPMGALPGSPEGKNAYKDNWRRVTAAYAAAQPAKSPAAKTTASKTTGAKTTAAKSKSAKAKSNGGKK